jgi:hypothetical protein
LALTLERPGAGGKACVVREMAIFRGDDDPLLVAAALACRACLSGDVEPSLSLGEFDAEAICRCRACGYTRTVSLTSQQALRLSLQPA